MATAFIKQPTYDELDSDSKEEMLTLISKYQQNAPQAKDGERKVFRKLFLRSG